MFGKAVEIFEEILVHARRCCRGALGLFVVMLWWFPRVRYGVVWARSLGVVSGSSGACFGSALEVV